MFVATACFKIWKLDFEYVSFLKVLHRFNNLLIAGTNLMITQSARETVKADYVKL